MSINFRLTIWIVVIILVFCGVWWLFLFTQNKSTTAPSQTQNNQNISANISLELTTSTKDASDSALTSDLEVINNQMQNLDADFLDIQKTSAQMATEISVIKNTKGISVSTIIKNADNEIKQKVSDLNKILPRVEAAKKIPDRFRNNLLLSIQAEINQLTELKASIDSDTSMPDAIIDYAKLTKSYRVYDLVMARARIIMAADRTLIIASFMDVLGDKVWSRISVLTGFNVSTLNQKFSTFTSSISDASAKATAAANEVYILNEDQDNNLKLQENLSTIKDAENKIQTAITDISVARKNILDIVKYLARLAA